MYRLVIKITLGLICTLLLLSFANSENWQTAFGPRDSLNNDDLIKILKKEAIKIDPKLLKHKPDDYKGKKINIKGKVSMILEPGPLGSFFLENNGLYFQVINYDIDNGVEEEDFQKNVQVWGIYIGSNFETGMPQINAILIQLDN